MKSFRIAAIGAVALAAGCGDGVVDPVVTTVTVTPDSIVISVTETTTLVANVADVTGAPITGQTVVWSSNDPDVATVTSAGLVTAIGPGSALVQATARGIRGSARVRVTPGPVAVLIVSPGDAVVDSGTTRAFEFVAEDAFGNPVSDPVRWTVSNPAVASVDSITGRATGLNDGTVQVIASVGGITDSAELVVYSRAFSTVSAGTGYSCAVSRGRSVYCWGINGFGVLGNGTTGGSQPVPMRVPVEAELVDVSAGLNHTCALTRGDAAICWGRNSWGQIGDNTTSTRPNPTFVGGGVSFDVLAVGNRHTCGVNNTTGTGFCWGNNDDGQLGSPILGGGLGGPPPTPLPLAMQSSPAFAAMTIGANHGCGVTSSGLAQCWGDGTGGALGNDTTTVSITPVTVQGGFSFASLDAGNDFTCGITLAGATYCWGNNDAGQLGTGDSAATDVPVLVNTGVTFTSVSTGVTHACGLTSLGDAYCWGNGAFGQLGDGNFGATSPTPIAVMGGMSFASIRAGATHTCAVTAQDVAYCWGRNDQGQLGDGNTADLALPTRVIGQ